MHKMKKGSGWKSEQGRWRLGDPTITMINIVPELDAASKQETLMKPS